MIEFRDTTIDRGGTRLLEGINLRVRQGEKTVVSGPSGSGKTSLLLTVMGIFPPSAGKILFDGREVTFDTAHSVRRRIAFISQEPVMGAEKVGDALMLPFSFKANRESTPETDMVADVLKRLQLDPAIADKESNRISAGEKQRIAIARALLMKKNVFLVDEATSALDSKSKAAAADVLMDDRFTLLSVSHDDYWIGRCETVFEMSDRQLVERR